MDDDIVEEVASFRCEHAELWGVVARPPACVPVASTAVLIVVGGPQYRAGSHRQFVQLARHLARHGVASLRFDYRGMGDSDGEPRTFEDIAPDVSAAIDTLVSACRGCRRVVVWGLCDAASAALMFATADPRVEGIVAANPWARSATSLAAARVKHYYGARLLQREFWSKVLRGGLDWRSAWRGLTGNVRQARGSVEPGGQPRERVPFQTAMARGLASFRGRMLLILSGNDLTAQEFLHYAAAAPAWSGLLGEPKVRRIDLPEADHTFSRRAWQDRVEQETLAWVQALGGPA
jgi:exosortase A-associated hydrolase 1